MAAILTMAACMAATADFGYGGYGGFGYGGYHGYGFRRGGFYGRRFGGGFHGGGFHGGFHGGGVMATNPDIVRSMGAHRGGAGIARAWAW